MDYRNYNPIALAFLGDAVYEEYIRERLIREERVSGQRPDQMHKAAVRFVKATAQCENIKRILESGILTEEEIALVKRARNHKVATKAKHASMVEYKWATAFEALLGYLHLSGQQERLLQIMEASVQYE